MIADVLVPYLVAWLWVFGIVVGALPLLLIHQLTGGEWGAALRPPLIAAVSTLPLVAAAFLPILLALHALYPWAREATGPAWYLNTPFFVARAIVYFVAWFVVARWSVRRADDSVPTMRASAVGLIVYLLTISLAAVDWIMSLTPEWHSTVFGLLIGTGQLLTAFAFAVSSALRARADGEPAVASPDVCNDFGNLLLSFVMLWAYMAISQYLVIWIGNLPHDISWYVVRSRTTWRWLGLAVVVLGFAAPFLVLLFKAVKRIPGRLFVVAIGLLATRGLDLYWTVVPTFRRDGFHIALADPLVIAVVIGGWLAFHRRYRRTLPGADHAVV